MPVRQGVFRSLLIEACGFSLGLRWIDPDGGGLVGWGGRVIGICREMAKNPFPHSGFGPAAAAAMHVLPIAEALRKVASRNTGTITK